MILVVQDLGVIIRIRICQKKVEQTIIGKITFLDGFSFREFIGTNKSNILFLQWIFFLN